MCGLVVLLLLVQLCVLLIVLVPEVVSCSLLSLRVSCTCLLTEQLDLLSCLLYLCLQ